MFPWLTPYEIQRKRMLKKAPVGAMKDFLSVPFPSPYCSIYDAKIVAVDFETTGLNAKIDQVLSIGYVEINHAQIELASSSHKIIKTEGDLEAENVVIHQITDDAKAQGAELGEVVENLLRVLAGKVLLVHFSQVEKQFLTRACLELYGLAPVLPIIDTLAIDKKRFDQTGVSYAPSKLRLSELRDYHHLPSHHAHNALSDAIATAELFLSQVNQFELGDAEMLKKVLR